jgi:hypothetical protein
MDEMSKKDRKMEENALEAGPSAVGADAQSLDQAGEVLTDAIDAGSVPAGLVEEIEEPTGDLTTAAPSPEPPAPEADAIDAGPVPAGLVDEIEAVEED